MLLDIQQTRNLHDCRMGGGFSMDFLGVVPTFDVQVAVWFLNLPLILASILTTFRESGAIFVILYGGSTNEPMFHMDSRVDSFLLYRVHRAFFPVTI